MRFAKIKIIHESRACWHDRIFFGKQKQANSIGQHKKNPNLSFVCFFFFYDIEHYLVERPLTQKKHQLPNNV